jgi:glycosyltransferase involved in cell wall biosynthesis
VPKVSVIIPNYNHARYLPQRIESVLNQTFADFEVIILDDCSQDNSLEIISEYAAKDKRISVHKNHKNSGSTFAQWNKGVALAKGEFVWIAESDDYCEPNLLETLLPRIEADGNIGIAFAQSAIVDEEGKLINSFNENYKFMYKSARWEADFVVPGHVEIAKYLIFSNSIPNASAALMRKSVYNHTGGAPVGWRLNGDWFFYVKMLLISDLAYCASHLNYFRQHPHTQRQKANANHVVYDEIVHTLTFIEEHVAVEPEKMAKAWKNVAEWWGGSLFRQKISRDYVVHNWRLFKFFRKKRPRIGLNILSNAIFVSMGNFLNWLGIKPVIKKWRAKFFPGKYFEY